jgi:hypothetical protein
MKIIAALLLVIFLMPLSARGQDACYKQYDTCLGRCGADMATSCTKTCDARLTSCLSSPLPRSNDEGRFIYDPLPPRQVLSKGSIDTEKAPH